MLAPNGVASRGVAVCWQWNPSQACARPDRGLLGVWIRKASTLDAGLPERPQDRTGYVLCSRQSPPSSDTSGTIN